MLASERAIMAKKKMIRKRRDSKTHGCRKYVNVRAGLINYWNRLLKK